MRHPIGQPLGAMLVALLALVWTSIVAAADGGIVVTVDTANVRQGESFVLSFEADSVDGRPDFTPLDTDFDVIGTSERTNINIVNGKMQKSTIWQLKLMAKRYGEIPIPAIAFGSMRSEALTLTVAPDGSGGVAADTAIRLEVAATPERPYVQAQVLVTVRLVVPEHVDLVDSAIGDPRVSGGDALITLLGKPRERLGTDNGERARIIERTYALFPQQHGNVTIEPIEFEGQVFEGAASLDDPFSQSIRTVRLKSQPIALEVRPIPPGFKGRHWLPAASVELVENWSDDTDVLKAGEPITRSVSLLARGVTAGQLPELDVLDDAKIRSYPEQPTLDDQGRSDGVIGLRMEKHALIAQANGEVTLPEIRVPWWNTVTDRAEEAVIPARTLMVEGGAPAVPSPAPAAASGSATAGAAPLPASVPAAPGHWPWLAAFLAAGWAATVFGWWQATRRRHPSARPAAGDEGMDLSAASARVVAAARRNDASDTRRQLLAWATAARLQPPAPETIARRFPSMAAPLAELERQLYAGTAAGPWRGQTLAEQFAALRVEDGSARAQAPALSPLHPNPAG
jgi:hypothetical protein